MATNTNPLPATVEPVFFKQKDIGGNQSLPTLNPYDVCMAVSRIVGQGNVDGAQNINGIWRVYLLSKESRVNLLVKGSLSLMGQQVQLYDRNPALVKDPSEVVERLTIKDLPLSVSNNEIDAFLAGKGLLPVSGVKYTRARDENGGLTSFKTGDRFVFVKGPILPVLPKKASIADFNCRTFHDGQFKPNCIVCNMAGHSAGDSSCPSRNTSHSVTAFHSHKSIFSNFYPCKIEVDGMSFLSVEHGYQWYQAKDAKLEDLAEQIINAPHAGIAKKLSKTIPLEFRENWEKINIEKMRTLLMAKVAQVPHFHDALIESNGTILAEATTDRFWASGLSRDITEKTKPQAWPGLNKLGSLLMDIRQDIISENLKYPAENTSTVSEPSQGGEDTDCEFFNTHEEEVFMDDKTALEPDTVSNTSGISVNSRNTKSDDQLICPNSTSGSSNCHATSGEVKTQTKLRQKTLTEVADKSKKPSTSSKAHGGKGTTNKRNDKQGEKRKPSRTPEKEKMSKLMKVFTKK